MPAIPATTLSYADVVANNWILLALVALGVGWLLSVGILAVSRAKDQVDQFATMLEISRK